MCDEEGAARCTRCRGTRVMVHRLPPGVALEGGAGRAGPRVPHPPPGPVEGGVGSGVVARQATMCWCSGARPGQLLWAMSCQLPCPWVVSATRCPTPPAPTPSSVPGWDCPALRLGLPDAPPRGASGPLSVCGPLLGQGTCTPQAALSLWGQKLRVELPQPPLGPPSHHPSQGECRLMPLRWLRWMTWVAPSQPRGLRVLRRPTKPTSRRGMPTPSPLLRGCSGQKKLHLGGA